MAKSKKRRSRLPLVNFKVGEADRLILDLQAKKYTNGNLSELLRVAAMNYKPKK